MKRLKKDWRGWWDGLRSRVARAGAESIVTNLTALIGSNGIAHLGVPGLDTIGMNWKTAILTTVTQFAVRVALAAALYVQSNPDPNLISVETSTEEKTIQQPGQSPVTITTQSTTETSTKEKQP